MRIVQVLRYRLICGPGAALTGRSSSGFSPDRPDSRHLEPNGRQKSAKQSGMVQILGFSGNSTDRPRASTVEVLSVVGPIAGSGTLEAVQAQHV